MDVKVKFGLKSFIAVVAILFAVLVFVGVLTFVIPAGRYTIYTTDASKAGQPFFEYTTDAALNKQIVIDSFRQLTAAENVSRLPVYRWLTAPFEALIFGANSANALMIIALLLVLGGTFAQHGQNFIFDISHFRQHGQFLLMFYQQYTMRLIRKLHKKYTSFIFMNKNKISVQLYFKANMLLQEPKILCV